MNNTDLLIKRINHLIKTYNCKTDNMLIIIGIETYRDLKIELQESFSMYPDFTDDPKFYNISILKIFKDRYLEVVLRD